MTSHNHFNRLSDKLLMRIFRLAFLSQLSDSEPYADGQSFPLSEFQALGDAPRRDLRTFPFPFHSAADVPRNITLVCRAWRTLSLQMHDLWAALVLGPTTEDYDQEVLDEWLYRQDEEPIHLFVQFGDRTKGFRSGDPSLVFQFRHNAERLQSITFDLHPDKENIEAMKKAFADLDRLKPPSLRRVFIQYNDGLEDKKPYPRLDPQRQTEPERQFYLSLAPSSAINDVLNSFPSHLLQDLEEYGAVFPAQFMECLPSPQGPTQLRVLHLLVPLTGTEIISWLNHCPLLVDARFRLSGKKVDEEELQVARVPNLRSLRISYELFQQGYLRTPEPLSRILDKLDVTTNFREAHFETKSHRSQVLRVILAFLDTCFTKKQIMIETLSLHGAPFKLQTSLSEGAYATLRQLRRLNVYERFLGQNGIVSLIVQRSGVNGELALPALEELHIHEYEPSTPEDIAAFICSHSYTRASANAAERESTSASGDTAGLHKSGNLRRVVFSYNGTKESCVPPIIANLAQWQEVADCVRDGLEVSVRLGSQLALP